MQLRELKQLRHLRSKNLDWPSRSHRAASTKVDAKLDMVILRRSRLMRRMRLFGFRQGNRRQAIFRRLVLETLGPSSPLPARKRFPPESRLPFLVKRTYLKLLKEFDYDAGTRRPPRNHSRLDVACEGKATN